MIVDSSALIAILRPEPDARRYAEAIQCAGELKMSAATYFETGVVIDGNKSDVLSGEFDELIRVANIAIEPVTEQQARIARHAYRRFGKGNRHPASLNFGDCFAYALAKEKGEPLLFKGNDFGHTDITPALK
jgi:ribonuclease VapC